MKLGILAAIALLISLNTYASNTYEIYCTNGTDVSIGLDYIAAESKNERLQLFDLSTPATDVKKDQFSCSRKPEKIYPLVSIECAYNVAEPFSSGRHVLISLDFYMGEQQRQNLNGHLSVLNTYTTIKVGSSPEKVDEKYNSNFSSASSQVVCSVTNL